MQKETILGTNVCVTTKNELLLAIQDDIQQGRKTFIVAINPEKILKARKDPALADLLNSAEYQIADGIGVVIASRLQKGHIRERVTGIDCMGSLCDLSARRGYRIFLYGAKKDVILKARNELELMYPGIHIVDIMDGYCNNNDVLIERINKSCVDIVFVALGSPKQENWIIQNRDVLCAKVFQGVGGSFDVISGTLKRAPLWMQKSGLEWLFRLLQQPERIFRQLNILKFLFLLIKDGKRNNEN